MSRKKKKQQLLTFRDVWQFPLELIYVHDVWGNNDTYAFDFVCDKISDNTKRDLVKYLNGEKLKIIPLSLVRDGEGSIFILNKDGSKEDFIDIRGWGHLTGIGGLKLPHKIAAKLQDEFADFIVEKLT